MNISRITKAIAELQRHDRFESASDVRNKDIDLLVPPHFSEHIILMAQAATALGLRCFKGRIRIHCAGDDSGLRSVLETEAKNFGAPERLDFASTELGPWRLALGYQASGSICIDASGWTSRINGVFEHRLPPAGPAIAFAVACGFAKLFNYAILKNDRQRLESWGFCLARFSTTDAVPVDFGTDANLGRVGLLGAGAIGSAVAYVLSISGWQANLDIIDYDTFEEPNLETCIMANSQDVRRPLRKALSLANAFAGSRVIARERDCKVNAESEILREQWDAFVCAVHDSATRLQLDHVTAKVMVNGGLGATRFDAGWLLWTQHGASFPTLSSLYKQSAVEISPSDYVPEEFHEECSRLSYNGVSLALPFAALAVGSLLVAGLHQRTVGKQLKITFLQMDLLGKQQKMTVQRSIYP